jgi:hypothetical protein
MKYEVQHWTLCDSWVNTWTEYDEEDKEIPVIFDNYETAQSALHTFLKDELREYQMGNIASPYTSDEFRIVKLEGATNHA